ncbi:MAG: hypothetical protein U0R50_06020 [Gaiellales bacterium]
MIAPPVVVGGIVARAASLVAGLFVFAVGAVLMLGSDLGLSPWDVLSQGLSQRLGGSFGGITVCVSFVVLTLSWLLGARIGVGTVANAALVGTFVDLLLRVDAIAALPERSLGARVALLVVGLACHGVGSALYLGAGLGAGPRDSLMLVVTHRTRTRIGVVRALLEIPVGAAGFMLGGTVGVGTIAFALGIGPLIELSCTALARLGLADDSRDSAGATWIRDYDRMEMARGVE